MFMEPIKEEMECDNRQKYRSPCCTGDRNSPSTASIPSCKWDAEDLHAIAKRADPRSAAYHSFDNGEMRCVRIF